jgi:hypothetical protein
MDGVVRGSARHPAPTSDGAHPHRYELSRVAQARAEGRGSNQGGAGVVQVTGPARSSGRQEAVACPLSHSGEHTTPSPRRKSAWHSSGCTSGRPRWHGSRCRRCSKACAWPVSTARPPAVGIIRPIEGGTEGHSDPRTMARYPRAQHERRQRAMQPGVWARRWLTAAAVHRHYSDC